MIYQCKNCGKVMDIEATIVGGAVVIEGICEGCDEKIREEI